MDFFKKRFFKDSKDDSVEMPIPTPRSRTTSNASAPSKLSPPPRPPKPVLNGKNLEKRLAQVEKLNRDWQVYNEEREAHVTELTRRYHELSNTLRQANEENCRLHSRALKVDQLKQENSRLVDKHQQAVDLLEAEREKCASYEEDLNVLNHKIDKLGTAFQYACLARSCF